MKSKTTLEDYGFNITQETIDGLLKHGDVRFAIEQICLSVLKNCEGLMIDDKILEFALKSVFTHLNELLQLIQDKNGAVEPRELMKFRGLLPSTYSMALTSKQRDK